MDTGRPFDVGLGERSRLALRSFCLCARLHQVISSKVTATADVGAKLLQCGDIGLEVEKSHAFLRAAIGPGYHRLSQNDKWQLTISNALTWPDPALRGKGQGWNGCWQ